MLRRFQLDVSVSPVLNIYLALIVLRPLIDTTWSFKHTWLVSPLQLVGALLAPFFVYALSQRAQRGQRTQRGEAQRTQRVQRTQSVLLIVLGVCVLLSGLVGLLSDLGNPGAYGQHVLRSVIFLTVPLFGVLYLEGPEVLERVALCLLLAVIFPLGMLYYEIIVGPVGTSVRSFSVRYTGLYAQVSVYGIHFALGVLGAVYLAVKRGGLLYHSLLLALLTLLAFALPYVLHLSSYAVLLGLAVLALYVFLRARQWWYTAALPMLVVLLFSLSYWRSDMGPMGAAYLPDVEVLKGERQPESFANSRGFIWKDHLHTWSELPLHAQLLGYGFAGRDTYSSALGFGAHNDFLRILFAGGVIGLLAYAALLLWLILRIPKLALPERVLLVGALIIWLGYSVALTPSYIMPLMVLLLPVFGALSVERVNIGAESV